MKRIPIILLALSVAISCLGAGVSSTGAYRAAAAKQAAAPAGFDATGLTHYWDFNEASGDRADSVGGATALQAGTITAVAGIRGNGCAFNNASPGNLLAASDHINNLTDIPESISVWYKISTWPSAGQGAWITQPGTDEAPSIVFASDGTINIENNDAGLAGNISAGSLGTWHFLVIEINGSGHWFYSLDDSALAALTDVGPNWLEGDYAFMTSGSGTVGVVDELAFWSVSLTQGRIDQLWNGGAGQFKP